MDVKSGRPGHPLRARPVGEPHRPESSTVNLDRLAAEVPFAKTGLAPTVTSVTAVGEALKLDVSAMLENLRLNLLGLSTASSASAHYLEVGAAGERSAPVWARMIDALEDGDRAALARVVASVDDGQDQLEDLLLHYRFSFHAPAVEGWIALAGDLSRLTDRDYQRVDLLRSLNRLELTNPKSEAEFVERAADGVQKGLLEDRDLEALVAAHGSVRLQRRRATGPVDGKALRNATVGAIRTLAALGRLPSLSNKKVTVLLVESPDNEASHVSLRQKAKLFDELGLEESVSILPPDTDLATLKAHIERANQDPGNLGTIVQLPIPEALRPALADIEPYKDIDCIGVRSVHRCPATAEAAVRAVSQVVAPGEKVLVVGGQGFIGSGVMDELQNRSIDAVSYELAESRDPRQDNALARRLKAGDVTAIISAANRPNVVNPEWCARYGLDPSAFKMIVDVGFIPKIDSDGRRQIFGSVSRAVSQQTAHTPVPGGIGPMEMAVLAERTAGALLGRPVQIWNVGPHGKVSIARDWST